MRLALSDRLVPCPFCATPNPRVVRTGRGIEREVQEVVCEFCGASAPRSVWNDCAKRPTFDTQPNPTSLQRLIHDAERST